MHGWVHGCARVPQKQTGSVEALAVVRPAGLALIFWRLLLQLSEQAPIWQKFTLTENAFYRGTYLTGDTSTTSPEACAEICSDPGSAGLFFVCQYW